MNQKDIYLKGLSHKIFAGLFWRVWILLGLHTVGELKIDRSFRRCSSSAISARALDSVGIGFLGVAFCL